MSDRSVVEGWMRGDRGMVKEVGDRWWRGWWRWRNGDVDVMNRLWRRGTSRIMCPPLVHGVRPLFLGSDTNAGRAGHTLREVLAWLLRTEEQVAPRAVQARTVMTHSVITDFFIFGICITIIMQITRQICDDFKDSDTFRLDSWFCITITY